MDWEALKERTLGEVGTALATEGIGVTGGFLVGGFLGRQIQDRIKPDTDVATLSDGVVAWAANNVPKLAAWYLLKKYTSIEPGEEVTPVKEATVDLKKAIAGSVVLDTIMRLANGGQNPMNLTIYGWRILGNGAPETQKTAQADVQRLIQENSALRTELNKALQRLATPATPSPAQIQPVAPIQVAQPASIQYVPQPAPAPVQYAAPAPVHVHVQPAPVVQAQPAAPPVVRYQPVAPPIAYSAPPVRAPPAPIRRAEEAPPMVRAEEIRPQTASPIVEIVQPVPPAVQERQRKYGFMAGEERDIAAMFGML